MREIDKIMNSVYVNLFNENRAEIQKDLDKLTEETILKINKDINKEFNRKTFLEKLFGI